MVIKFQKNEVSIQFKIITMQGGMSMKKTLIIVFLFCAATMLAGLRTGFAYENYGPDNCKACHLGNATVHAQHNNPTDCTLCHVVPGDIPKPSKCAVCHPVADPGQCSLVEKHVAQGGSCLGCHEDDCACPLDTPEEVLEYDEDGSCRLNKEELKKYSDTLKADQKQEKDDLKIKQTDEKDEYNLIKKDYSTK